MRTVLRQGLCATYDAKLMGYHVCRDRVTTLFAVLFPVSIGSGSGGAFTLLAARAAGLRSAPASVLVFAFVCSRRASLERQDDIQRGSLRGRSNIEFTAKLRHPFAHASDTHAAIFNVVHCHIIGHAAAV